MISNIVHKPESNIECVKTIHVKGDFVKICGRFSSKITVIEYNGIRYKLNLCGECFEELKKKELKELEKIEKNWQKTDFKCPECGSIIYKHYHIISRVYHWFWCPSFCVLDCRNCKHGTDTHGDVCDAFLCMDYSGWESIKKEIKVE